MKTLSGTFAFVALTVIASVTLPSCYRKKVSNEVRCSDQMFYLEFGTKTTYVEVTSKDAFIEALRHFAGDQYQVNFLDRPDGPVEHYPPLPHSAKTGIKTDKVTTSELAQNSPAGESAAYDPNATYRVYSNDKTDIENVLKTFKASPTPAPSP